MDEKRQKLVAAGATVLAAEPLAWFAHFGGTGVIAGLAAGAIAYLVADEIHQAKQGTGGDDTPPAPVMPREKKPASPGRHSLAYRLINGKSVRGDEEVEAEGGQQASPSGLPRRSPTFAEMKHLIKPGRDILGFDGQKFVSGVSFSQVVNIVIIGMPRHGKTTCLRFHMAQGLVHNAIIRGWDIQGDVAGEFGDYLCIAETVPDILADCEWVEQELERRADLYKRCRRHDPQAEQEWSQMRQLLYIIDEFLLLTTVHLRTKAQRDTVTNTLLNLIAGASKYKVRVILSGQALPADLFGDQGTTIRDIISTKYAFASEDRQARMIGIDAKAIKEQMPLIAGEDIQGYSILAGGPLAANRILSIPDTTFQDLQELLEEQDDFDQYDDELEEGEELPEGITETDLEEIAEAYKAGWSLREIADQMPMDPKTFRSACELLGIDPTDAPTRQHQAYRPDTRAAQAEAPVKLMPKPAAAGKPKADYPDAVRVWNELGGGIGRPRLKKELEARGFDCTDDLAKKLLARIEEALKAQAADAGGVGGGAVVGEE